MAAGYGNVVVRQVGAEMHGMTGPERMQIDALERKIAALEQRLANARGMNTQHGALQVRATQVGFAAELTSSFNSSTGYSWKQLRLQGASISAGSAPLTGDKAFAIDGDETLESGAKVWLEPDPTSTGYLIVGGGGGSESPGSTLCSSRGWWGKLRSDAAVVFTVTVPSKGSGACNCADDTYTSTAAFDTSSWDAADDVTICTNDFTVSLTKPGGVPTMTLTPVASGSAMTVAAHCYGDGWAEFSFPGDIADEGNCTDPVTTGCDADNGFIMRVECACSGINYNGAGWYILTTTCSLGSGGSPVELSTTPPCECILCPGGPYATEAEAITGTCLDECGAELAIPKAPYLEAEFFDGTSFAVCLDGYIVTPLDTSGTGHAVSGTPCVGTHSAELCQMTCVTDELHFHYEAGIGALPSSSGSSAVWVIGDRAPDSITGEGETFEATWIDLNVYGDAGPGGSPIGTVSVTVRWASW